MFKPPKLATAPRVEQKSKRSVKERGLCSKDLALNANKRADMILRHKLSSLESEKEHSVRVYKLNRLKMTRVFLGMEKSAKQCRDNNFDKHRFPCFWDPENDSVYCALKKKPCRTATQPHHQPPLLLYGEEPSSFLPQIVRGDTPDTTVTSSSCSLADIRSDTQASNLIMKEIRRIKEDACSRQPKKFVKKVISLNRFVNEFEWLDTSYTQWFMEKTSRIFHGELMAEISRKEKSDGRLKSKGESPEGRNKTQKSDIFTHDIVINY